MTVLVCDCNGERACAYHAEGLYAREEGENYDAEVRAFADAGRDFYIPGWTPDDADTAVMDNLLIAKYEGWNESADCACNSCVESLKWYNS